MKAYALFVKRNSDGQVIPWDLTYWKPDFAERKKSIADAGDYELVSIHEIDIEPDAGMQTCDVTQLAPDGRPQVEVDREAIDHANRLMPH